MATSAQAAHNVVANQTASALSQTSSLEEKAASADAEKTVEKNHPVHEDLNGHNQGVSRIEALYVVFGKGWKIWGLYLSIALIAYVSSLASNTIYVYLPFATSSFGEHSTLGTITVVTSIIASVGKPFIAKIADLTSRPHAYLYSLVAYVLGLIILASSTSVNAVAAGQVFYTIGNTGFDLVLTIILGDITSLEWRGMSQAIVASPYIVNAFIAGYISSAVSLEGWRWGYGMFAIILPVCTSPALYILFWADMKAQKLGAVSIASPAYALNEAAKLQDKKSWSASLLETLVIIDGLGLVLLGFAWSLILLPFTLSASANGGWKNASMLAMEIIGILLLITFTLYEFYWAKFPLMPKRVMNRTFLCCIAIDFLYYLSGYIQSTYYSSYVYVIRDWSTREYTFFLNTLGVGLCFFSLIAGGLQRYFHNYKWVQLAGICMRAIGMGLVFLATGDNATDVNLVMAQVMISLGGSFSVIGSQVASQASVPHADMATAISLLSLWTGVGGSIGSAISAAIWTNKMPGNLENRLQDLLPAANITAIYGSLTDARFSSAEVRAGVIEAYDDTSKMYLYLPALILAILPLIPGAFTSNFYLGTQQNAIEDKEIHLTEEVDDAELARRAEEAKRAAAEKVAHAH
ncbi:major facilitator superfamily domain-containing protein [Leucosporidium creatinivorum]|uniref:Major facilitator superfamily domain-containing protein n=1 Tax=Leucosporidium creatinivorum TaxID=106004 RepID=A0A1Y2E910_9BASI|nr:major facilitator superfamily domain-containing protein [Leucosporidium creatinivorum]